MDVSEVDEMNLKINTIVRKSRKGARSIIKVNVGTCLVIGAGFKPGTSTIIQLRPHLCHFFIRVREQTLKALDLA